MKSAQLLRRNVSLVFTWSLLLGKTCKRPLNFTKSDCKSLET